MNASLKSTKPVLLPVTKFTAHGSSHQSEPVTLKRWDAEGLSARVHESCSGKPRYVLHDGPPYANGEPHLGHALNKVLKDMVVRSHRMMGRDAVLVPGWDCHGLPVEWKVEQTYRQKGLNKTDVPALEFRKVCQEYAEHWVSRQMNGFKRFGVTADWDNPYLTMSNENDAATVRELHKLLLKGLLYRERRPVLWSVPERTALADAEVEYREERYTSLMVRFPLKDAGNDALQGAAVVCWTTTSWSLPGNRAVACSPSAEYGVYSVSSVTEGSRLVLGEKLVLGRQTASTVLSKAGAADWSEVAVLDGSHLAGLVARHPLYDLGYQHDVPVLAADFVETSGGTGLVHVAPGLGPDDYRLGKVHGLEVAETVGENGRYVDAVPHFAGLTVVGDDGKRGEADTVVLQALEDAGQVVSTWRAKHETAHSWRSGAPLVYRATPQWFVRMDAGLREKALSELDQVSFLPEVSRKRLTSMVEGRPDWCVSRQRLWGVPLGLFVDKRTGEPVTDPEVLESVQQAFSEEGANSWYDTAKKWHLGPERNPDDYEQVMDVLDVWFESGSSHASVLDARYGEGTVADLYLEGADQHRGWFQSSLLESVASKGRAPYKVLFTHGFVLDKKGKKMSNSLGNVVCPLGLADKFGAETLRLWFASADTSVDLRHSDETVRLAQANLRKLRNTLRWMLGNLASSPSVDVEFDDLEEAERWVLARLNEVGRELRGDAEALNFGAMLRRLTSFASDDLSAFWFVMRKDALYCDASSSLRRRGVVTVLRQVCDHFMLWLAPLLPMTADEAWREVHGNEGPSVHEHEWPTSNAEWEDMVLLDRWRSVRVVRDAVMAAMEPMQKSGEMKSVSSAHVVVHAPERVLDGRSVDVLALVCGAPSLELAAAEVLSVDVRNADGEKCVRCWNVLPEVSVETDRHCHRCLAA